MRKKRAQILGSLFCAHPHKNAVIATILAICLQQILIKQGGGDRVKGENGLANDGYVW